MEYRRGQLLWVLTVIPNLAPVVSSAAGVLHVMSVSRDADQGPQRGPAMGLDLLSQAGRRLYVSFRHSSRASVRLSILRGLPPAWPERQATNASGRTSTAPSAASP